MKPSSKKQPLPSPFQQRYQQQSQPFLITKMTVASRSPAKGGLPKLCKKCESLTTEMNSDSIHATLAYSRCRCHRLFKYRARKLATITSEEVAPQKDLSHNTAITTKPKDNLTTQKVPSKTILSNKTSLVGIKEPVHVSSSTTHLDKTELSSTNVEAQNLARPSPSKIAIVRDLPKDNLVIVSPSKIAIVRDLPKDNLVMVLPTIPGAKETSQLSLTVLPSNQQLPELASKTNLSPTITKVKKVVDCVSRVSPSKLPLMSHTQLVCNTLTLKEIPIETSNSQISNLIDMVKFIDSSKKKQLKDLFRETDKNGDGHITCTEFLRCLPVCASCIPSLLQQFYVALNDITYFGCREFILCYCIAERLIRARVSNANVSVNLEFLEAVLSPLMKILGNLAIDAHVTTQNIKDSVVGINQIGNTIIYAVSANHLNQIFGKDNNEAHILDCLALAPYYLVRRRN